MRDDNGSEWYIMRAEKNTGKMGTMFDNMDKDIKIMFRLSSISLREALEAIEQNTKGMLFLGEKNGYVCGVITDGDIRRALLSGAGLNDKAIKYMNSNFVFAYDTDTREEIFNKLGETIKIIPVLNKEHELVDYVERYYSRHVPVSQPDLRENEYKYLMDAFFSTWISSTGKFIDRFESSFSAWCDMKYGVATSSGTTALHLALVTLGIKEGDEVIVPDLTFAATINAVLYTGARPVIVDIEGDSWCISPAAINKAITDRTRAIIPVHVYGQPCDMTSIMSIARENNLYVVEDCAEAHGAEWDGKRVGSFGDISCFSFFGNKVITTGEGGMCLTNDKQLNNKMRKLRDHGMSKDRKYYHDVVGFNYRMTNMQAAIGTAQVERIDDLLSRRMDIENEYYKALGNVSGIIQQRRDLEHRNKIAWLVSVLVDSEKRDAIIQALKRERIDARPFFTPLSDMEIYKDYAEECVESKYISRRGINLPTNYEIDSTIIQKITRIIRDECAKR